MKARFLLVRLSHRGGTFYCLDNTTGKRTSLFTKDKAEATQLVAAKNEAERNPQLNLQMARVYLSGSDSQAAKRTWGEAMQAIVESKAVGSETRRRWTIAVRQKAFDLIRNKALLFTTADDLMAVLQAGTVSTKPTCARSKTMHWA